MEEKRKYPRTEINEPAYVSSGGSVMSCVVRNISFEGANIEVANPAFVPAHFRLVMARDSSVRECSVAWIQKTGSVSASLQCRKVCSLPRKARRNARNLT